MRERSLRLSLIEAFLYSLMVGAGETYLPAYALSIGMGEVFAGILSTLPIFSGAFLQLITPRGLQRVQSHKHWVVASATIQALTFLPLIYFSVTRAPNFWTLLFILTLYWGSGFAAGPAWNYWMGRLILVQEGNRYFAKRARVSQFGVLFGLVGGGLALHSNIELGPFSSMFTVLFLFAGVCRLISSALLSTQFFDPSWNSEVPKLGLRASWKVFWGNKPKREFFLKMVPFQAAVFVTSPFVAPYMLSKVKMDYHNYMVAIAMLFVGKIAALYFIDSFKKTTTGARMFLFGAVCIAPMPALWALSENIYYIYAVQALSGMIWAFVEVGLSLMFFTDLRQEEKVPVTTIYNLLNSLAIMVGTFLGGKILWYFGSYSYGWVLLYLVGGLGRLTFAIPLYRHVKAQEREMGVVPPITERAS